MTEEDPAYNMHRDILKKIEDDNRREAASQGITYEELMHRKIKEKHGEKFGKQIIKIIIPLRKRN